MKKEIYYVISPIQSQLNEMSNDEILAEALRLSYKHPQTTEEVNLEKEFWGELEYRNSLIHT